MIFKHIKHLALPALLIGSVGCGGSISPELRTARNTVEEAKQGLAQQREPEEVRVAERLLARAESQGDGSEWEQHYAYLADRHARLAMARANMNEVRAEVALAEEEYQEDLEDAAIERRRIVEQQGAALSVVQADLARVRTELEAQGDTLNDRTAELQAREAELAAQEAELLSERQRRAAAEEQAADAMAALQELADIREEQDETIITLNGEVIFETDRAELRSTAAERLQAVARALQAQPNRRITIEGHTDSRGTDAHNRDLSQRRAQAVLSFLTANGVDASRLTAVGRGESEPTASNQTPEGRANNRRVEIHLGPASDARQASL